MRLNNTFGQAAAFLNMLRWQIKIGSLLLRQELKLKPAEIQLTHPKKQLNNHLD